MRSPALLVILIALLPGAAPAPAAPPPDSQAVTFFENQVRPVLAENCLSCHGPRRHRGGLRLDSRPALIKGGDTGPAVQPGQPNQSLLIRAVRREGELKMPPRGRLDARAVAALTAWVQMGAPWPSGQALRAPGESVVEVRQRHWSFQPVHKPSVPAVREAGWVTTPVDAFVLARLEARGLAPAPPADRRTLIRRLSLDLLGLPPTPEEVQAFQADPAPDAYERLVDRLLASPRYGERWARHWLDVARYADTKGYVFEEERRYPWAYTYRDYVIRAFNQDRPYDRFLTEQLAADLLPPGPDNGPLAALGFLTLGRRFLNNPHDIIDDRIDVTMRGLQGLTVTCARCHDHKFDPIPTRDYYSLYGVFASASEPLVLPLLGRPAHTPERLAFEKELRARQAPVNAFRQARYAELLPRFRRRTGDYLLAVHVVGRSPNARPPSAADLNRALLARWRAYLAPLRQGFHPIFGPWQAFAAIPEKEFAAQSAPLAARLAANADPSRHVNPVLARAFAGKPPASLAEVARLYDRVLAEVDRHWQEALRQSREHRSPAPVRLPDADEEALRQVLYGPDAPANVPLADIDRYMDRAMRNKLRPLRRRVEEWMATGPGSPPRAMVLRENPVPNDPRVFIRGNPNNPGEAVPRQFLEVLSGAHRQPFRQGSGRLELARAIASKGNPLTARVLVNRVWQHHFGAGLVRTPGDFGLRGEPPTHPELLDYLAATFMEQGWSVKRLHRLILLSSTYRQGSDNPLAVQVDADNRLLARMNQRRLDFEALRDSLLAVAGRLDSREGGPPVVLTKAPFPVRRTIYGFIDRQNLPGLFRAFDFASPDTTTSQRHTTTVPQQALFLLNSPFVAEQARHFATRPDVASQQTDAARIDRMYWLAYGRAPEPDELALGLQFLAAPGPRRGEGGPGPGGAGSQSHLSAWEQYAQVLLLANEFAFVD